MGLRDLRARHTKRRTLVDDDGNCEQCGQEGCQEPHLHAVEPYADVRRFHEKFNLLVNEAPRHLTQRKLNERVECMREELDEFIEACSEQDLAAQADALVDLVYFALGTAVMMGLPWQELWDDVQRANMAKVRGISHRGHKVDCVKPPGWVPPQTHALLKTAGYDSEVHSKVEHHCDDEEGQ